VTWYRVTHTTRYRYGHPVSLCHAEGRVTPRALPRQRVLRSDLRIEPPPATFTEREDFFGNRVVSFTVEEPHDTLEVTCRSEIETSGGAAVDPAASPPWEEALACPAGEAAAEWREARQFALASPSVPVLDLLRDWASASFAPGRPLLEGVRDLVRRIHREYAYDPQFTTVTTPLEDVVRHRRGVCQDFAHLAIGCLRSLGLSARYVSGYLETLPPPGKPRLVGTDASHAWFSAYTPGLGWTDFDPTNDQIPSGRHVTVAWGRDYGDVTPLKGVILGGGEHDVEVSVDVARVE
jgi:transglutaminase-like putative cysteine protease